MRAGLLTEQITIKRATITKNEYGEDVESISTVGTYRARLLNNNTNRAIENNEIVYDNSKQFIVRIYVDVRDYDLLYHDNRTYRVIDYQKDKQLNQITITAALINE